MSTRTKLGRMSRLVALAGLGLAALAPAANATWSILLVDTRTGEIALGSATCLTGFDLRANTPVLIPGYGGCTAQSFVDSSGQNRAYIRDLITLGVAPSEILTKLATFDTGHQTRQYGFVDVQGRAATFSGTGAGAWAGGTTGKVGDIVYAIQGNVLSGQCVVDAAVQAVINTPGDLAAKMMASMEAARVTGGDGRCSCTPANPPGCGCPPTSFVKSSHIAYMLISREGDLVGANGLYRVGQSARSVAAADLNADGKMDAVVACQNNANLWTAYNITPANSPLDVLSQAVASPIQTGARAVALGDLTGDGKLDAAVSIGSANLVLVAKNKGDGTFETLATYPAFASNPTAIAVVDIDGANGPDVLVQSATTGLVAVRLNQGAGVLGPATTFSPGGSTGGGLAVGDINSDGKLDFACVTQAPAIVAVFLGDGAGGFTLATQLNVPLAPADIAIADLDADGLGDLVTGRTSDKNFVAHLQGPVGTFGTSLVAVAANPTNVAIADMNGDGKPDLVGSGPATIALAINQGAGNFAVTQNATTNAANTDLVLADLDGDGDKDVLSPLNNTSLMTVQNHGDGTLASGLGGGAGDYFMNFNIANQSAPAPDPVFQLKDLYDQWREDLKGRPDAVRSLTSVKPGTIPPTPGTQATVLVELLDWQGLITSVPSIDLAASYAPGSAGATTIQSITPQGGNVFTVQLLTTGTQGIDRLRIVADDGIRPVTLMPDTIVQVGSACAPDCDGNGELNIDDFICFQTLYAIGDPKAECDGNGELNIDDFICFQTLYAIGC